MMEYEGIQFCSGGNHIVGWLNLDEDCDISKPLPFASNSQNAAFCEHGAEHVSPVECLRFFEEVYRILKADCSFRLCIPVLDRVEDSQHAHDLICLHGHRSVFTKSLVFRFLQLAGFQPQKIKESGRVPTDAHHLVIGKERDDLETCRVVATK